MIVLETDVGIPVLNLDWDPFEGHGRILGTSSDGSFPSFRLQTAVECLCVPGVVRSWDLDDPGRPRILLKEEGDAISAKWIAMEKSKVMLRV